MASKEFILQGFTSRTHAAVLRELFGIPDIERVVISVAFVGDDGVRQIEDQLRSNADQVTVLAGIRNDITSYQAIMRLHEIIGDHMYVVDTGSRNVIFHPKVYLVRGKAHARLIIGSANLTLGGLNNNIEAGMMLEFDLADESDKGVVDEIEAKLLALPTNYPENVIQIRAASELDELLAGGRLIDEMAVLPPRPNASAGAAGRNDAVPRITLLVPPLRRALRRARAPRAKAKSRSTTATPAGMVAVVPAPLTPVPTTTGVQLELVWESKPLTRRDLTIPDADGTHATGSMNLDKGLLPEEVDHRHYFREEVFPNLTWTSRGSTVDEAFAKFQLVIKNINYGEFDLRIGLHDQHHKQSLSAKERHDAPELGANAPVHCSDRFDRPDPRTLPRHGETRHGSFWKSTNPLRPVVRLMSFADGPEACATLLKRIPAWQARQA